MRCRDPRQEALAVANRACFRREVAGQPVWFVLSRIGVAVLLTAGAVYWMTHAS